MNTPSNPLQEAEQLAERIRSIIRGRNLPPEANINMLVHALVHEAVAFNRNDMENVLRAVRMTWLSIQAEQPLLGEGLDPIAKMNRLKILLDSVVVGESLPLVVNVLVTMLAGASIAIDAHMKTRDALSKIIDGLRRSVNNQLVDASNASSLIASVNTKIETPSLNAILGLDGKPTS